VALLYVFVAKVDRLGGADTATASPNLRGRHAARPAAGTFTKFALDYVAEHPGRAISVLQAGCATAGHDLDLAALRASAAGVVVWLIDDDSPETRTAVASRPELREAILADLRSVPLAPRSFDIVHCPMLLDRITNAGLVFDRLVAALRPGGLLLVRTPDRQTAAGFLDRRLPRALRAAAWPATRPGQPGPFPAIYEPIASARGLAAFMTRQGLAVAHRETYTALDGTGMATAMLAARRLVAWLSRGRLTCRHDELRYVLRKPQDQFARVLQ
jgi:SAM-dependent methyltransferase